MPGESVMASLDAAWAALEPLGIPMAVMGGISVSAWGYLRNTHDVDILIGVEPASFDQVIETMRRARFRAKRRPLLFRIDQQDIAQFLYQPGEIAIDIQVDLLLVSTPYQQTAMQRRVPIKLTGVERQIYVLACEDVILHKLIAGRMIDRADAAMLLRENRDELNQQYLQDWITRLGLEGEYAEIHREAFPDAAT